MKRLLRVLIFNVMLFSSLMICNASGIEKFYINAEIQSNGDIVVEEYFYLNKEYNAVNRTVLYSDYNLPDFNPDSEYYGKSDIHNASDIELMEIRTVDIDPNFNFENIDGTLLTEDSRDQYGNFGVYKINYIIGGESYDIYIPSQYNKAFYIKYTLKDVVVVHNDIAEIYWSILKDSIK